MENETLKMPNETLQAYKQQLNCKLGSFDLLDLLSVRKKTKMNTHKHHITVNNCQKKTIGNANFWWETANQMLTFIFMAFYNSMYEHMNYRGNNESVKQIKHILFWNS